jgi:hypothetical protein
MYRCLWLGIGGYCYQINDDKERPVALWGAHKHLNQWPIIQKEAYLFLLVVKTLWLFTEIVIYYLYHHRNLQFIKEDSKPYGCSLVHVYHGIDFSERYS